MNKLSQCWNQRLDKIVFLKDSAFRWRSIVESSLATPPRISSSKSAMSYFLAQCWCHASFSLVESLPACRYLLTSLARLLTSSAPLLPAVGTVAPNFPPSSWSGIPPNSVATVGTPRQIAAFKSRQFHSVLGIWLLLFFAHTFQDHDWHTLIQGGEKQDLRLCQVPKHLSVFQPARKHKP